MILNGKIVTTKAKAKAIQGDLERMVTLAKKADINARRKVLAYLDNAKETTSILFNQVAKFFANRTSGFTRLVALPRRRGDMAQMVRIEWTESVSINKQSKDKKELKSKSKGEKTKGIKNTVKRDKKEIGKAKKQS